MDATSIHKAKLLAAAICRVADYHALAQLRALPPAKGGPDKKTLDEVLDSAERSVAVALENMIDSGALE
jgi:hypothetical protein